MAILVTGAAGFIGAALAERLLARGDAVIGIDNLNDYYQVSLKQDRLERVRQAPDGERFTFLHLDFADRRALGDRLGGREITAVAHLGAQAGVRYSRENPYAYAESNLVGHLNMLELARQRQVGSCVYASSSSVYGGNTKLPFAVEDRVDRPVSLYAATKRADELMSETYAHLFRVPLTGLRFFTVYGPWGRPDMMLWDFTRRLFADEPLPVFNDGQMWRDFTHIDDIIAGVVACLDQPPTDDGGVKAGGSVSPHALYNIGNNRPEKLTDVIALIEDACGRTARLEMLPMQPGDVERTFADIDAITRDHGFRPTISMEQGVPQFVRWYRDYCGEG